jgi:MFS family permease
VSRSADQQPTRGRTDASDTGDGAASAWSVVWALSVTQIISWGSLFYAFSVLLAPIGQQMGWARDAIVGAFSLGLLVAGVGAAPVGILLDRFGGRIVMSLGSLVGGAVLALMSTAQSVASFYIEWAALGIAGAMLLYEPAFAVIYAAFASNARKAITALTLVAGFASTIFWPLTQALVSGLGWRNTFLTLGLMNLLVCLPLHLVMLPSKEARWSHGDDSHRVTAARSRIRAGLGPILRTRSFWLLAFAFTTNILAFSALSVHLIPLLQEKGFSPMRAVWLAALVGPAQVAGRLIEFTVGRRFSPRSVGLVALGLMPVALVALLSTDSDLYTGLVFAALYGASNGVMTIIRATIPAELFGRQHYGAVNGALAAPVIASRAAGPLSAALIWSAWRGYDAVLWTLGGASILAMVAFSLALTAMPTRWR